MDVPSAWPVPSLTLLLVIGLDEPSRDAGERRVSAKGMGQGGEGSEQDLPQDEGSDFFQPWLFLVDAL